MLLNIAFLKLNGVLYVLVVYICSCTVKNKWLP